MHHQPLTDCDLIFKLAGDVVAVKCHRRKIFTELKLERSKVKRSRSRCQQFTVNLCVPSNSLHHIRWHTDIYTNGLNSWSFAMGQCCLVTCCILLNKTCENSGLNLITCNTYNVQNAQVAFKHFRLEIRHKTVCVHCPMSSKHTFKGGSVV